MLDISTEDGLAMIAMPVSSSKKKKKHKATIEEQPIDSLIS